MGIGFGIGSTLAEVVLTRIFLILGGVWQTVSQRFPHEYTDNMITRVVAGGLVPGAGLARVDPGTPSAGISLLAIALYNAVLVAAMLVAVRVRDVTA